VVAFSAAELNFAALCWIEFRATSWQFYRHHPSELTILHAELLEQEDAVRTADTCRDLGWDLPVDAYADTCGLSQCVPIVAKHDK
jgi:hypothetical protein